MILTGRQRQREIVTAQSVLPCVPLADQIEISSAGKMSAARQSM
jgi:hypothetical protein